MRQIRNPEPLHPPSDRNSAGSDHQLTSTGPDVTEKATRNKSGVPRENSTSSERDGDRTYRILGVAVVPVDGEEEAAAGLEGIHIPGALRREAHGRGVQPLQLRADRLVEVDEDEHRRLRRRPSARVPSVRRGRGARNRRRDRSFPGYRRRHHPRRPPALGS